MSDRNAVLRILDVNGNRAAEGFRVIEEYLRLVLGDRHLTQLCKDLRHELAEVLSTIPSSELLAARDTPGDIGTQLTASDEYERSSSQQVWQANQKRVEQSLRCLEEFSKTSYPAVAKKIEAMRYRCYTLAKAIQATDESKSRLAACKLYVLVDGCNSLEVFDSLIRALIEAGVHALQLRDKRLQDRELLERARRLRALTRGTSTLFIMNDRPDLAQLAHADGVHLGQDEMEVSDARAVLGTGRLVGVSTHSVDQARQAVLDGADYIGCGPTFPSVTKKFEHFPGLDLLRAVSEEITLPAFAIGGISSTNLSAVLEAGFTRIAVAGAVTQASSPADAARQLLKQLVWDGQFSSDLLPNGASGSNQTRTS